MLSLFLGEPLSTLTVLSLSRVIAEHRDAYYRAFETAENPLNKGELTFFVYRMLELVRIAQTEIIRMIDRSKETPDRAREKMEYVISRYDLSEREANVVFMLIQYELFGMINNVTYQEAADLLGLGKQMARKYLLILEKKGLVKRVDLRPASYALVEGIRSEIGMEEPGASSMEGEN